MLARPAELARDAPQRAVDQHPDRAFGPAEDARDLGRGHLFDEAQDKRAATVRGQPPKGSHRAELVCSIFMNRAGLSRNSFPASNISDESRLKPSSGLRSNVRVMEPKYFRATPCKGGPVTVRWVTAAPLVQFQRPFGIEWI